MADNRCPNCENDITQTVTTTLIAMLQAGERGSRELSCPHCAACEWQATSQKPQSHAAAAASRAQRTHFPRIDEAVSACAGAGFRPGFLQYGRVPHQQAAVLPCGRHHQRLHHVAHFGALDAGGLGEAAGGTAPDHLVVDPGGGDGGDGRPGHVITLDE